MYINNNVLTAASNAAQKTYLLTFKDIRIYSQTLTYVYKTCRDWYLYLL